MLSKVCYTVGKVKGKTGITNATPGVFFYDAYVTPSTSNFCLKISQTKCSNFNFFLLQPGQLYLWSSANNTCTKVGTQTIKDLGNGEYQLCVTGATAGTTYVLTAKYDVKSLN